MATLTPARLLRVDDQIGRLAPGLHADLVHLTDDLRGGGGMVGRTPARGGRRGGVIPCAPGRPDAPAKP